MFRHAIFWLLITSTLATGTTGFAQHAESLEAAAASGDLAAVERLLSRGADPNARGTSGELPLVTAAVNGELDAARALLAAGADPNARLSLRARPALLVALLERHRYSLESKRQRFDGVIDLLLRSGADPNAADAEGLTPMLAVARSGTGADARRLIAAGADIHAKLSNGVTPLISAASWGNAEVAGELLLAGADANAVDATGRAPLHVTVAAGSDQETGRALGSHLAIVEMLLAAGARIDGADAQQSTPLMLAAEQPGVGLVELLLHYGASPLPRDAAGQTALHRAAAIGPTASVAALLRAGADVNARDAREATPLTHAAAANRAEVVRELVAAGADLSARDASNRTPLETALSARRSEAARELVAAGAPASAALRLELWADRFARYQGWLGPVVIVLLLILFASEKELPIPRSHRVEDGDGLPRLAPLKCSSCRAPVPIVPEGARCPSCGRSVKIPEDYEETLAARARGAEALARAMREWGRLRRICSLPVVVALVVVGAVWVATTALGVFGPLGSMPLALGISSAVSGLTLAVAFTAYAIYLAKARSTLPVATPLAGRTVGEPEVVDCRLCGAPIDFAAGMLAASCAYCGGEHYRVALARRARAAAAREAHAAELSIYRAMVEIQERKMDAATALSLVPLLLAGGIYLLL